VNKTTQLFLIAVLGEEDEEPIGAVAEEFTG